jgi:hypothetical protein
MKSKLEQRVKTLEQRVAALEKPVPGKGKRGWLKLAGWAKDDPLYDEAMKLGAAWRKTS